MRTIETGRAAFCDSGCGLPSNPARSRRTQPSLPDLFSNRTSRAADPELNAVRPPPARQSYPPSLELKSGAAPTLHHPAPRPLPAVSDRAHRPDTPECAA